MRDKATWTTHIRRRVLSFLETTPYVREEFASCAANVLIDSGVFISDPKCVSLGEDVAIYRGTSVHCGPGMFTMAEGSHLAGQVYVNAIHGLVAIGRGVAVGPLTAIMSYSNHYAPGKRIVDTRRIGEVHIGDDSFIGAGAVILPGVRIGIGAVIGAGAIVTRDVEPYRVMAGNPARVMKIRER